MTAPIAKDVPAAEDRPIDQEADLFSINAVDHVEFWVGNAKQAAFYWKYWGFKPAAAAPAM